MQKKSNSDSNAKVTNSGSNNNVEMFQSQTTRLNSDFNAEETIQFGFHCGNGPGLIPIQKWCNSDYSNIIKIINTSYQKLPFGSGDYPDKIIPMLAKLSQAQKLSNFEISLTSGYAGELSLMCPHSN